MKALKTIGKVTMAIVACAAMPVLIWVAMGAAIYQKARVQTAPAWEQVPAEIKR